MFPLQELAGYTGGDASFLKEDFELQLNRRLFWDSVRQNPDLGAMFGCLLYILLLSVLRSFLLPCGVECFTLLEDSRAASQTGTSPLPVYWFKGDTKMI